MSLLRILQNVKARRVRLSITSLLATSLVLLTPVSGSAADEEHGHEQGAHEGSSTVELTAEAIKAQGITVEALTLRPVVETLPATAEIGFNEQDRVVITARSSGWAEKVAVFANQLVEKNQLLASVYSPEFLSVQNEYLLILARANRGGTAAAEAKTLLADARQRLRILGLTSREINKLARTRKAYPFQHIHSPISGTVIEHRLNTGDTVEPGQKMYVIASLGTVWAEIALTETQLGKVHPGQAVIITVKAYPDQRFNGKILSIGAGVDDATRTVKARALIQNPKRLLKPGMFADAEISVGERLPELVLSEAAVLRSPDGDWVVFVEEAPGHFKPLEVKIVRNVGRQIVIEGPKPGTRVVTKGAFFIQSELAKGGFEVHQH